MISDDFRADRQGRRYSDLSKNPAFDLVLSFFDDPDRQRRMIESEQHHLRPPLAGVVRELEVDVVILLVYFGLSPKQAVRFRQAIGVVVRLVMHKHGWHSAGTRGSLAGLPAWRKGGIRIADATCAGGTASFGAASSARVRNRGWTADHTGRHRPDGVAKRSPAKDRCSCHRRERYDSQ